MTPFAELRPLLSEIRQVYLDFFRAALADLGDGTHWQVESEMLDRLGSGVREGTLGTGLRRDIMILGDQPETVMVTSAQFISFARLASRHGNLEIDMAPFTWDQLHLTAHSVGPVENWSPLRTWFERHFAEEAGFDPTFFGCIHFLSDPDWQGDRHSFEVDLGSAPVEALIALLDALEACKVTRLTIGGAS